MKTSVMIAAMLAFTVATNGAMAKSSFGDPSANVRVDSAFVDVGDRASTYEFSSPAKLLGLSWIGGGKRPLDLRAILGADTRNSRLDTEGEVQRLLDAARASTGSFAFVGERGGALSFELTNTHGTTDAFVVNGVSQVPIPGAVWLLASGLGGLAWARRRRS